MECWRVFPPWRRGVGAGNGEISRNEEEDLLEKMLGNIHTKSHYNLTKFKKIHKILDQYIQLYIQYIYIYIYIHLFVLTFTFHQYTLTSKVA